MAVHHFTQRAGTTVTGATASYRGGLTYDIAAGLVAGGGAIDVDDTVDADLVEALRAHPALTYAGLVVVPVPDWIYLEAAQRWVAVIDDLGAAYALDATGRTDLYVIATLTADCILTIAGLRPGGSVVLEVHQDVTGGHSLDLAGGLNPAGALLATATALSTRVTAMWVADDGALRPDAAAGGLASPIALTDIAATGTLDVTTFLRGDGAWAVPLGAGGANADATIISVTDPSYGGGARGDGILRTDAAINSGSNVLNAPGASFAPSDVGKLIVVEGAGASLGGGSVGSDALVGYIGARNSATQVTIVATPGGAALNAGTTVAVGGRFAYGSDDAAPILAAYNAWVAAVAAGWGAVLYFPRGFFMAGSSLGQLAFPKNARGLAEVRGAGKPATVLFLNGGGTPFGTPSLTQGVDTLDHLLLSGFTIDKVGKRSGAGILNITTSAGGNVNIGSVRLHSVDLRGQKMIAGLGNIAVTVSQTTNGGGIGAGNAGAPWTIDLVELVDCNFGNQAGDPGGCNTGLLVSAWFSGTLDTSGCKNPDSTRRAAGFAANDWIAPVLVRKVRCIDFEWNSGYRTGQPGKGCFLQIGENAFVQEVELRNCKGVGQNDAVIELDSIMRVDAVNLVVEDTGAAGSGIFHWPLGGHGNPTYGYLRDAVHRFRNCKLQYTAAGDSTNSVLFNYSGNVGIAEIPSLYVDGWTVEALTATTAFQTPVQISGAAPRVVSLRAGHFTYRGWSINDALTFAQNRPMVWIDNMGGRTDVLVDGLDVDLDGNLNNTAGSGTGGRIYHAVMIPGGGDTSVDVRGVRARLKITSQQSGLNMPTLEFRGASIGDYNKLGPNATYSPSEDFTRDSIGEGEWRQITAGAPTVDSALRATIAGAVAPTAAVIAVNEDLTGWPAGPAQFVTYAGGNLNVINYTAHTGAGKTFTGCTRASGTGATLNAGAQVKQPQGKLVVPPGADPTVGTEYEWLQHNIVSSAPYPSWTFTTASQSGTAAGSSWTSTIGRHVDYAAGLSFTTDAAIAAGEIRFSKHVDASTIGRVRFTWTAGGVVTIYVDAIIAGAAPLTLASQVCATALAPATTYTVRPKFNQQWIGELFAGGHPAAYTTAPAAGDSATATLTTAQQELFHRHLGGVRIYLQAGAAGLTFDSLKLTRCPVWRDVRVQSFEPRVVDLRRADTGAVTGSARGVALEGTSTGSSGGFNSGQSSGPHRHVGKIYVDRCSFEGLKPAATREDIRCNDAGIQQVVRADGIQFSVAPPAWLAVTARMVKGTHAARPAADLTNVGLRYLETDVGGGTEFGNLDGATWTQLTPGLSAVGPSVAVLSADTASMGSATGTALQDVPGLAFAIGASNTELWEFEALVFVNTTGGTAQDIDYAVAVPAAASAYWGEVATPSVVGVAAVGSSSMATVAATILREAGHATLAYRAKQNSGNGTDLAILLRGQIRGGGTAGNVQLQISQDVATPGESFVVKKGSFVRANKLIA